MVSPYLLKPLRSLQEAAEGVRAPAEKDHDRDPVETPQRALKAEGPGVQFWDSRVSPPPKSLGPRLVWTNAARGTPTREK